MLHLVISIGCLFSINLSAQKVYVVVGGGVNTSFLLFGRQAVYQSENRVSKQLLVGADLEMILGVVTKFKNVAPCFEFGVNYSHKTFSERVAGIYNNGTNSYPSSLSWTKSINDVEVPFRIGFQYKGLAFLTGYCLSKTLRGRTEVTQVGINQQTQTAILYQENRYFDFKRIRHNIPIVIRFQIVLLNRIILGPELQYNLGIINSFSLDTPDGGSVSLSYLNSVMLKFVVGYLSPSLKKKEK